MPSYINLRTLRTVLFAGALFSALFFGHYQSTNAQFPISQDEPVEFGWFAGNVRNCVGSIPVRVDPLDPLGWSGLVNNLGGTIVYPSNHFRVGLYEYSAECVSNVDNSTLRDTAQLIVRPLPPNNPRSSCTAVGSMLSWDRPAAGNVDSFLVHVTRPSGESCPSGWTPLLATQCIKTVTDTSVEYPTMGSASYTWKVWSKERGITSLVSTSPQSFSCTPTITSNAQCSSISVPATVTTGQAFTATFTLANTGITTWSAAGPNDYLLGIVPAAEGARWGSGESLMGGTTAPGGSSTFTVNATAPTVPGTYSFDWQMVQRNVGYFGSVCRSQITVTSGSLPENGMCGSAHLTTADSYFDLTSEQLCRQGVPRSLDTIWVSSYGNVWGFQWICKGRNGGADSDWCQVYKPPQCGSAHGTYRATAPVDQSTGTKNVLCYVGLPNNVGLSPTYKVPGMPIADYIDRWVWKCDNSGSSLGAVQCVSYKYACSNNTDDDGDGLVDMNDPGCSGPTDTSETSDNINGACGTAHNGSYASQPATNLCTTGAISWTDSVASDGSYNWSCLGSGTGSTAQCVGNKAACSNNTDDDGDGLVDMNDPGCSGPTDTSEEGGAINGSCGLASGGSYASQPTTDLCTAGTVNWIDTTAGDMTYNWSCLGTGGGANSPVCSATKTATAMGGSCGMAHGGAFASAPSSNLCAVGGVVWTDAVGGDGSFDWNCDAALGGPVASCSATNSTAPRNGQCAPTHYACTVGTSANWQNNGTQWTWTCNGVNGGAPASCTETSLVPSINLIAANTRPVLNQATTLTWTSANNPTNCKLYIDKPQGSGNVFVANVQNYSSGTYPAGYPTVGINEPTRYTVMCDGGVSDAVILEPAVYSVPSAAPAGQQVYENEPFTVNLNAWHASTCYYTQRRDGVYQLASYYEPRFDRRGNPIAPAPTDFAPIQDGRDGWTVTTVSPTQKRFSYSKPSGTTVVDGTSDSYYWSFRCAGTYGGSAASVPVGIGMTVYQGTAKARPTINAGPDQTIVLPATTATLDATISDPGGWIAFKTWSKVPATAEGTIATPLAEDTQVMLPATPGTYTFRLNVRNDLMEWMHDDVTVTVLGNSTDCPATTNGNCVLPSTPNGGTAGTCATSYSGTCNYRCESGNWTLNQPNTCTPTPPPNCVANTLSGNCRVDSTAPGSASGSCVSGHTGSCNYTCTSGPNTWSENSNTCAPARVTQFTVCDSTGTCANPGETLRVPAGAPLTVKWNATNADFCNAIAGTGFATGGRTSGEDPANASSLPNNAENYTISCGNNGSGSDTETVIVQTNPAGPDINSPTRVVNPGTTVPVTWDVGASNPGDCTITGPGVNFTPTTNSGSITPAPTINSKTTYTIDCGPGLVDTVTIELRPGIWET